MPLRGRAFLPLWSGLLQGYERELDRWHTIEHMPERLGIPGFLRGRRYMHTKASGHAMFILYEAAHIETFRSPGLLARLNDPTEWSKRVQPGLVNFIRGPCQTLISLGDGVGGALVVIRVSGEIADKVGAGRSLAGAAPAIAGLHGVDRGPYRATLCRTSHMRRLLRHGCGRPPRRRASASSSSLKGLASLSSKMRRATSSILQPGLPRDRVKRTSTV